MRAVVIAALALCGCTAQKKPTPAWALTNNEPTPQPAAAMPTQHITPKGTVADGRYRLFEADLPVSCFERSGICFVDAASCERSKNELRSDPEFSNYDPGPCVEKPAMACIDSEEVMTGAKGQGCYMSIDRCNDQRDKLLVEGTRAPLGECFIVRQRGEGE